MTTFRFAARPGVRDWVCDLAKREAACCPFLSYEIVEEDEKIVWTTAGLGASDIAILDEFLDEPASASSSVVNAQRLRRSACPQVGRLTASVDHDMNEKLPSPGLRRLRVLP